MTRSQPLAVHDLNAGWQASKLEDGAAHDGKLPGDVGDWFVAQVPGAIQYDLIAIGKVGNPYASSASVHSATWVHESDWVVRNTFDFAIDTARDGQVVLEVDGIDTFADLWLNGILIGTTANAYRSYRFEIAAGLLKPRGNVLNVHIKAHKRMVEHLVPEAQRRLGPTFKYKGLIRRYQRSFFAGSSLLNLGGEVLGIGIYKPMRLVVEPQVRFNDVHFTTLSVGTARAEAEVAIELSQASAGSTLIARLVDPDSGITVAEARASDPTTRNTLALGVDQPRLWWPRGYGEQNRYRLEVSLEGPSGVQCGASLLVGLRTSRFVTRMDNGRDTYQLYLNDKPIHVRGHNTIPVDYIKVHGSAAAYEQLLKLTCDSNSNMLRIWGGGGIDSPAFYDACDAMGIMIWQDFYLHSNTYPDYDEEWVAAFREECEELLVYLRNHPALVVVCGGNEQYEGWDEWGWRGQLDRFYGEKLFTEVGKGAAEAFTPELPYVLNSPHGGGSCQSPIPGDVHNWGNFYNSTKDPLFVTETCWSQQSYSRAETLERVMGLDLEDYADIGWPSKWKDLTGLELVTRLPYTGGPLKCDTLRNYIKGLELEQALADHHALSQLLMRGTSCNGLLYWPLNKGGPLFQFGCVDYDLVPLASYYVVKRLFADLVVTIYRDIDDIRVVGVNRSSKDFTGELVISHVRVDGSVVSTQTIAATIPAGGQARLATLVDAYHAIVDRNGEVMKAALTLGGEVVSEETLFFTPLMEFAVKPDSVKAIVRKIAEGRWEVDVSASSLVKLFAIEGNGKFLMTDNYFALTPGMDRTIGVELLEKTSAAPLAFHTYLMDSAETQVLPLD